MSIKYTFPYQFKIIHNQKISDKGVTAYPGKIKLQIGEKEFVVHCYFVKSNTMPLLGRLDIWDKFNLFFDNKNSKVIFEKI